MPAVGDVARCPCGRPATYRLMVGDEDIGVYCTECAGGEVHRRRRSASRPEPPVPHGPFNLWCYCPDPRPQPVRLFGAEMLGGWWECARCRMPVAGEWHDTDGNLVERDAVLPRGA